MKITIKKPEFKNFAFRFPKVSLRSVGNLTVKELYNFFTQPIGYIISFLFLFTFLIMVFGVNRFLEYGTNDLTPLFGYLAFILVIVVPAITMGSFAKERVNGTLEFLLTRPIREIELIISKVLGNSLTVTILILLTSPFVFATSSFTQLDFGQVVMQYLGAIVLGVSLVSLGVAISSVYKSEIGSFLTSLIISALLILVGSNILFGGDILSGLPSSITQIMDRLSLNIHYQSLSKGVIDLRDVIYFIAFISTFVLVAYYFIKRDKLPVGGIESIKLRNLVIFLFVITLLIGYFGQQIVARIDVTSNKLFTLSDASINVFNNAKDIVTIDFFRSSGLPLDYQAGIRSIENLLSDYENYSGGKLELNIKDPSSAESTKNEAIEQGLRPINFTARSNTSAQVVEGFLGIVIKYKGERDLFNLIDVNNGVIITNPEYELTKKLRQLTNEDLSKIAFVSNNVDGIRSSSLGTFNKEISSLYDVTEIELLASTVIPEGISALIIAGPNAEFESGVVEKLREFYDNGGSIFLLTNTLNVVDISQTPTENLGSLANLFEEDGVKVNTEIVYDLENSNSVRLRNYLFPIKYPFWLLAQKTNSDISITRNIQQISTLWPNTISLNRTEGNRYWELIKSGVASNIETLPNINLNVDRRFEYKESDSSRLLAVAIENNAGGRAVISSDWKFLGETFDLVRFEDNLNFGIASIEWLTKEEGLSEVKAKDREAKRVLFNSDADRARLLAISIVLPIGGVIGIYAFQYYYRKRWNEIN